MSQLAGKKRKELKKSVSFFCALSNVNIFFSLLGTHPPPRVGILCSFWQKSLVDAVICTCVCTAVEFPAVLLDLQTGVVMDEFQQYVQPQENPILSDFCKELTGISQVMF